MNTSDVSPTDCLSYRLRRASRLVSKHYDKALKPAGLKATQFTLLSAVRLHEPVGMSRLAEELGYDISTVTRNLAVLDRRGLTEIVETDDGRERAVRLSPAGETLYQEAYPLWRSAHLKLTRDAAFEEQAPLSALLATLEDAAETN